MGLSVFGTRIPNIIKIRSNLYFAMHAEIPRRIIRIPVEPKSLVLHSPLNITTPSQFYITSQIPGILYPVRSLDQGLPDTKRTTTCPLLT